MLNSFQHLIWFFSAFGRHTFHPRPQDGVFRCDLNKEVRTKQVGFEPNKTQAGLPAYVLAYLKTVFREFRTSGTTRSGQAPRKGFIGQYRFCVSRVLPMRVRDPQTLKGWLPIHPVPGLMKPWRGVWPDQWSGEEKLGTASPLS